MKAVFFIVYKEAIVNFVLALTQATVGGSPLGLLFQWPGVTRASNPFVPIRSYVFFMVYIDQINPQCKGDLGCAETSS